MIYQTLQNPLTREYLEFKSYILGPDFNWFYLPSTLNIEEGDGEHINFIYHHRFLEGPSNGMYIPLPESDLVGNAVKIIEQILQYNNIKFQFIYRIAANSITYTNGLPSPPHLDHVNFYHKNLIIYLNQFDSGNIDIYDDDGKKHSYKPNEDDVVTFDFKKHSVNQPTLESGRRVVFAATYL